MPVYDNLVFEKVYNKTHYCEQCGKSSKQFFQEGRYWLLLCKECTKTNGRRNS